MAKKIINTVVGIIILFVAVTVVAVVALPFIVPFIVSGVYGETDYSSISNLFIAGNPIENILNYTSSTLQSQQAWMFFAVYIVLAIIAGLFVVYAVIKRRSNRSVEEGVLGNATLIQSPSQCCKRNVVWDGQGEAPGASLVYGFEKGKMIGDPDFAHGFVDAKSGCGKSRSIGYPSLYWNVKAGASVIYTARKLTDYKLTFEAIEASGVKTYLLDLEHPHRGCRLNLMNTVNDYISEGDIASAQRAARQLASNFIKESSNDPYFSNAARALMTSIILVVAMSDECPPDAKNLISVATIIRNGLTGKGADPAAPLKDYLHQLDKNHPAYKAAADFLQDKGTKAAQNVASTLMTSLSILGDEGIEWMLSGSDFTLRELAEKQCVLFPHCMGEDDAYNVILSAMYDQLWVTLQDLSNKHGERLPHPFVILGDEFGNLPAVTSLGEMVSLGRSMDLHVFVFVQNLGQLNKYNTKNDQGAGVQKILGSMNLQIAMSVMEVDPDGKYFSALCGKKTVLTSSSTKNYRNASMSTSSTGQSLQEHQEDLIPAYTFKDRVPLKDGIIVIKGGENTSPEHHGVFEIPLADASHIKPVAKFFGLGTRKQDTKHCSVVEDLLQNKIDTCDQNIPFWCIDFSKYISESTREKNIADDEFGAWDQE